MSRHEFQIDERFTIAVGFDPPLQTFFGIVYDTWLPEDDADEPVLWVGMGLCEITNVRDLQDKMKDYVTFTDEVIAQLHVDQVEALPPTELQKNITKLFTDHAFD